GGMFVLVDRTIIVGMGGEHRLLLHHVNASGSITCQELLDTVQVLPPLSPWIIGFHQGVIIPSLPQGPSNTPTCIVVWEKRSGSVFAERVNAMGNRVWAAPVTVAQGTI